MLKSKTVLISAAIVGVISMGYPAVVNAEGSPTLDKKCVKFPNSRGCKAKKKDLQTSELLSFPILSSEGVLRTCGVDPVSVDKKKKKDPRCPNGG